MSSDLNRACRRLWAVAAATLVAVSACTAVHPSGPPGMADGPDAVAIRDSREAQSRAIATGDVDRIASFWTEDVSIRRALGAMVNGRAAYRQLFAEEPVPVYLRHTTRVEVSSSWPLAFETGDWEGRLDSASGQVVIGGHYSAQWVKRDGRWLIRGEVYVPLYCAGIGCTWKAVP